MSLTPAARRVQLRYMKKLVIFALGALALLQGSLAFYQYNNYNGTYGEYNDYINNNSCATFSIDLARGDRDYNGYSTEVLRLQTNLSRLGYLNANPNGVFGPATQRAVMNFQFSNGISPTGIFGPKTRSVMNSQICSSPIITPTPIACTMEARLCPDGSVMPRDPDCTWRSDRCAPQQVSTCQTGASYNIGTQCVCPSGTTMQYNYGSPFVTNYTSATYNTFSCITPQTSVCPVNTTITAGTSCNCPSGYYAQYSGVNYGYTNSNFVCTLSQNSNYNNNYNYNTNYCSINTSIYVGVGCTCPAGSVIQYNTTSALSGNATFSCVTNYTSNNLTCPLGGSFLDTSYSGCSCPSGYVKRQSFDIVGISGVAYKCN